jgi:hypothetical protein
MELLVWDVDVLRGALEGKDAESRELSLAFNRMLHGKLAAEVSLLVHDAGKKAALITYANMLEVCLADDKVPPSEKRVLRTFRLQNDISTIEHDRMVSRFGYTPEEFRDGGKTTDEDTVAARRSILMRTKTLSVKRTTATLAGRTRS